jgi:PknH-like extracellular domain
MRQLTTAVAVGMLAAACGGNDQSGPASSTTTTTSTRPPVAQAALANLLLTPAELDTAMGVTGTTSKDKSDKLPDDSNKQWPQGWKFPAECLYVYAPGEAPVYAGSGYTAASGVEDVASLPSTANEMDPDVAQVVVLFPSANEANALFTTSSQRWPACGDRQFTVPGDADNPEIAVKVGPISNANGTLSTTVTLTSTKGANSITGTCQRALTARNNVAVDVAVCRSNPGDQGVKIASQIAAKVDKP